MKKIFCSLVCLSIAAAAIAQNAIMSTNGMASFSSKRYNIQIILVDDPEKAVSEWNSPAAHGVPGFSTVSSLKRGVPTVPLILFNVADGKYARLSYNAFLQLPDSSISEHKGERLTIVDGESDKTQIFMAKDIWGWIMDETDEDGEYEIIVQIYDDRGYKQEARFPLRLEAP